MRENGRENIFGGCLVRKGDGKKKLRGFGVFFLSPPKCFLPKMERKLSGDKFFLD